MELLRLTSTVAALVGNATRHPVYLKQIPEEVETWLVVGALLGGAVVVSIVVWSVLKVLGLDYWSHWSTGDVVPFGNPDDPTKEQPDHAHDSTL